MPQLTEGCFANSVTLVCQHDSNGALGVIVNRLSSHTFADIFSQLDIHIMDRSKAALPIFDGGPVRKECGLIIHSNDPSRRWESTLTISSDLALTSSKGHSRRYRHRAGS